MIPVFHFSRQSGLIKVKSGTFFAENPDSMPVLRSGIGSYGRGYVYEAEIDPVGAVDLLDWDISGLLAWGSKRAQDYVIRTINTVRERNNRRYVHGALNQKQAFLCRYTVVDTFRHFWHSLDIGTDDDIIAGVWDRLFEVKGLVQDIVKVAKKPKIASLYYDTEKDRAGRVWIVVDPQVVSKLVLVKQYDEYTAEELEEISEGRHPG